MVALSMLVLMLVLVRHHTPAEAALLLGLMVPTALTGRWLLRDLRVDPARQPASTG
jgi:hypothetical protein